MLQSDITIKISSEFDTPEFIKYSKDEFKDLMDGTHLYLTSKLYTECVKEGKTGRCGSQWKLHFFIYRLSAKVGKLWTRRNFETALYGKAKLTPKQAEQVKNIITKLSYDPELAQYFKGKKFMEAHIHGIVFKYQVERKALVERKMLEICQLSDISDIRDAVISQAKVLSTKVSDAVIESTRKILEPIIKYLELKYDVIYSHIKKEGVAIQGEMRRGENRFRKINRELFDQIISELEEDGIIAVRDFNRKRYLICKI